MADNLNASTLPKIDLTATIARLRDSKAEYTKSQTESGFNDGALWAKDCADYSQLEKLAQIDISDAWQNRRQEGDFACWLDSIVGVEAPDSIFEIFIETGVYPSDVYAQGFVEGALEVWAAVSPEL